MLVHKPRLSGILSANASALFLVVALVTGSITCSLKAEERGATLATHTVILPS
ncbi:MAG: hypothetical protein AAFQ51_08300 [Pseudomonadota bacterium]